MSRLFSSFILGVPPATRDGQTDVQLDIEDVVISECGAPPAQFDPEANATDRDVQKDLELVARIDNVDAQLIEARGELAQMGDAHGADLVLVLALLIEFVSSIYMIQVLASKHEQEQEEVVVVQDKCCTLF